MTTISVIEKVRVKLGTYSDTDVRTLLHADHEVIRDHEALEHHIKEDESKVFEELGEHFSDEQREAMGVEFTQGKLKLLKSKTARAASPRKRETANT
jgi:hypothetical protein